MRWRARWQRTAVGTSVRWVASPPHGDGAEKVGNAHHGGLNQDLQDVADLALGRREFFGLLAWRTVSAVAGCILVGQLADGARGDDDPPPVAHNCDRSSPNKCEVKLNECTTYEGTNKCSSILGPTNTCPGPVGGNSCRGTKAVNTCTGGSGQEVNKCSGAYGANSCVAAVGANTCTGELGFSNCCQPANANVCEPPSSNFCTPDANVGKDPATEPPPGQG